MNQFSSVVGNAIVVKNEKFILTSTSPGAPAHDEAESPFVATA
jgi:hypothetical protein